MNNRDKIKQLELQAELAWMKLSNQVRAGKSLDVISSLKKEYEALHSQINQLRLDIIQEDKDEQTSRFFGR